MSDQVVILLITLVASAALNFNFFLFSFR
jgi:hypothetical protein